MSVINNLMSAMQSTNHKQNVDSSPMDVPRTHEEVAIFYFIFSIFPVLQRTLF